ncbi:MAG: aldehyde reductase [Actinobacteria bacterium]|nr:aldehyde reductase [Actinomycetota bacterium]
MGDTVLVTGGTGFVAGWCIVELLRNGHSVRATLRDPAKAQSVRDAVARVVDPGDRLQFVTADLMFDQGWDDAVAGCRYVLHVASPLTATRDEGRVIRPAVDGVLRVLRASRDAGVQRVVFTSSCGAVYYGHPSRDEPFDESDWTDVETGQMSAYVKSKALAERAAWKFIADEGNGLEFTAINPTGIFGPALSAGSVSSLGLIQRLLNGMPACPDLWMCIVDVRDVADLHLRAMTAPMAGQRYIANASGPISMLDIARELRGGLGEYASRVPLRRMPDWIVRLLGRFNVQMNDLVPLLGQRRNASAAKAQRELGWRGRSWRETVVASARSLIDLGVPVS